ncbi:Sigma54 specific transcriptional regulator with PAS/PAC sensor, Fis family (modular protein) [uncultured Woeseiaceae bacterium]|uniref:Sigma54 specific transcriptional regulator with PAS/PAC sensor, Fis family (Modular protein) n=1 Tax=uncultured Woeseiaceae bacterium TaxID=1983305 RepID=A0A7D9H3X8_9GAMM|nr:Sigma54 specific transcriptional regulator with PAS/PAC sensor, Fis family (modular protein) [uncultured Woeseiaceae bacterium]
MTTNEELQQLQTEHQLILDAAGEGIYGLDGDGRITFCNAAATEILGWRIEDVRGQRAHDVHHHSHADGSPYPQDECLIYAALYDGEIHRVDNEVFWHFDGSCVPVEYVSTPILQDGKRNGAVVIFRDISRRQEIERQREQAHDELSKLQIAHQLILDAAGEGIYGLDSEGRITFGNSASTEILGWHVGDVHGQRAHEVHHHSHADGSSYPREECPIYAAITDGKVHRVDNEVFWHTNGSAIAVEYTSTPIMRDGKPDGAVVIFRDISKRKEIERQREEAYEVIKGLKEQLENERDYLRDEINVTVNFGEIIGESQALKRALAQIEAVAPTPASVLILGDSGTGKEMIARAIHAKSARVDNALVKVNCASIPKDLFESEFFGHVRGAFTGAHQDRLGRLQLADGGTLFLDEVGEIPMSQQGKLLRALQEGEFERVGDNKTMKVDVRVVAATNRNLMDEIKAGRFREDLFYRLSVFPLEVPPLRDRLDDVAPLAVHFLEGICRELGREPLRMTQNHLAILKRHDWPGNIRELKNVIERAVISSTGSRLRLDLALSNALVVKPVTTQPLPAESPEFVTIAEFQELEKANLIAALQCANWKVWGPGGAADLLAMKPSTLTYQMKTLGVAKQRAEATNLPEKS